MFLQVLGTDRAHLCSKCGLLMISKHGFSHNIISVSCLLECIQRHQLSVNAGKSCCCTSRFSDIFTTCCLVISQSIHGRKDRRQKDLLEPSPCISTCESVPLFYCSYAAQAGARRQKTLSIKTRIAVIKELNCRKWECQRMCSKVTFYKTRRSTKFSLASELGSS